MTLNALARSSTIEEVRAAIRKLNLRKAPDYDLIINQVLQKPKKGIKFIIHSVMQFRRDFFLSQWKVAQIVIKLGKLAELIESYRINFLSVL